MSKSVFKEIYFDKYKNKKVYAKIRVALGVCFSIYCYCFLFPWQPLTNSRLLQSQLSQIYPRCWQPHWVFTRSCPMYSVNRSALYHVTTTTTLSVGPTVYSIQTCMILFLLSLSVCRKFVNYCYGNCLILLQFRCCYN